MFPLDGAFVDETCCCWVVVTLEDAADDDDDDDDVIVTVESVWKAVVDFVVDCVTSMLPCCDSLLIIDLTVWIWTPSLLADFLKIFNFQRFFVVD